MLASDVLDSVARQLNDALRVKLPPTGGFIYLSDGIRELVRRRPDLLLGSDGSMSADPTQLVGGDGTTTARIRNGVFELWDTTLEQYLPTELRNGQLVVLSAQAEEETTVGSADISAMDFDLGLDLEWRPQLVDYVLFKAKSEYAESLEDRDEAASHYKAFREGIGA